MLSFKDYINAGLLAHQTQQAERDEISLTLQDLDNDVTEVTQGAVGIKLEKLNTGNLVMRSGKLVHEDPYTAIVLYKRAKPEDFREVARWEQSDAGYPCSVITDDERFVCMDRASLVETLGSLLVQPSFGRAITELAA